MYLQIYNEKVYIYIYIYSCIYIYIYGYHAPTPCADVKPTALDRIRSKPILIATKVSVSVLGGSLALVPETLNPQP